MHARLCVARRSFLTFVGLLILSLLSATSHIAYGASHGALDTTFDGDGKVTIDFGATDTSRAVVVQPDGKILVAGARGSGALDFVVARLSADGTLDATFGTAGIAVVDFGGNDAAFAIALQADGKIVVAGYTTLGGNPMNFAVVRLDASGQLDPTLNGTGTRIVDFGGDEFAKGVAIQDDGKIVVAGTKETSGGDFAIARLTTAGALDATFGVGGRAVVDFGGDDRSNALAIGPDGRIVIVGSAGVGVAVARLTSAGTLDPTFDSDGRMSVILWNDNVLEAVAIQSDGRIVAAGHGVSTDQLAFAMRLTVAGALDPSFGGDGWTTLFGVLASGSESANGVVVLANGKVAIAGTVQDGAITNFEIELLGANGVKDATFNDIASATTRNGYGRIAIDFGGTDSAHGLAMQPDGALVVVGDTTFGAPGATVAVARVGADTPIDVTFNTDGRQETSFVGGGLAQGRAVLVQPDGKTVVAGLANGGSAGFAIARYTTAGAHDRGFSGDGKATVSFGGLDYATAMARQVDGRLIVVGYTNGGPSGVNDFALARFTTDGTLDTTFNHIRFPSASNGDGRAIVNFGGNDRATAVAIQPDGKIVVVGSSVGANTDYAIMRANADGSIDTTFGTAGMKRVDFGGSNEVANAVAIQPDGRIVVAGYTNARGQNDFAVIRLNDSGSLDPSFSGGGQQIIGYDSYDDRAQGMALQPDGKIVLVGTADGGAPNVLVVRLTSAGVPDTSFGSSGLVNVVFGGTLLPSDEFGNGIALQADGKIVVVGYADAGSGLGTYDVAIARLNANGGLDSGFADDGHLLVDFGGDDIANGVAIDPPTGKAVVVGTTSRDTSLAVVRLAADTATPPPPLPALTISGFELFEGNAGTQIATFGVLLSFAPTFPVSAVVTTSNGSAVAPGDYTAVSPTLLFVPGDNFEVVQVLLVGDAIDEADEGFSVTLSNVSGATMTSGTAAGVILDDDLSVAITSPTSGPTFGTSQAVVSVGGVAADAGGIQSVTWVNAATGGSGTATGTTAWTAAVPVSAGVNLVTVTAHGAYGFTATDTLTITAAPALSISDATVKEGNSGTVNAVFTVTLSLAPATAVSVVASTADGTASHPADFASVSTQVSFAVGQTSKTVTVPVVGDVVAEGDETFTVTLSGASGATIADGTGVGLIRDDELVVTITSPTTDPTFSASQGQVTVGGTAESSGAAPIQAVTWVNAAGGSGTASGTTAWTASIPLVVGTNVVTVTVRDTNGITATDAITITLTSVVSYLAEGATSNFLDTRLALLNPSAIDTVANLTFSPVGASVLHYALPVPAHTRATLDAKTVPGLETAEFSTKIESTQRLVVDRTMTWDATGYGAHAETSVPSPSPTWYLAEGATHSGFDLFYLLQNPAATATTARVRYLRPSGNPIEKDYVLPPTSRTNIWVNTESFPGLGLALAATDVSAVITSLDATPIIVERALYLSNQGRLFNAGHESAGVTAPALQWFLAEGATGAYFDLFVLVANPNNSAATVRLTYLLTDGRTFTRTMTAAPNSRSNVWVDIETFDGGATYPLTDVAVSTTVASENGVPIIVERALWWPGAFATWHEAHNSAGATATGTVWALADGEVGAENSAAGDETYILIANTSAFAGEARVTLYFEDGTNAVLNYPLPPKSRTNVAVWPDFGSQVRGRRFGAVVESLGATPAQIVVERAMYRNAGGVNWAAGTNALATRLQ